MRTLLALLVAAAPLAVQAQDPPIRWGRLSDAEKALDAWPGDPDAQAVVLGDVGFSEVTFESRGDVVYKVRRHRRVKVLSEGGYSQGEFAMRYDADDQVRGVKGQTFVPDGDGDYRRVDLDGDDVFDEAVDGDTREVRFSMPALEPGAIFEFEYTFESENVTLLPSWTFQSDEPTVVSELRLELPSYFEYVTLSQGALFEQQETERLRRHNYDGGVLRWTAENVPALRDEPYTTTEADFVERIGFQLRRIHYPDGTRENVLSEWDAVAATLATHPMFGLRMERNPRVREVARGVAGTDEERARALYDVVREGYVWNGRGGWFAERDLDDVVETKSGSAAELAFLLLEMYEEAGIPAQPVLISTRSNGRAVTEYPIVDQFNRLLVRAMPQGGAVVMLDPTSPYRPYGEVDVDALTGQGWVPDPARPQWVRFAAPRGTATTTQVTARLLPDGALEGDLRLRVAGYDAFDTRVRLAREAEDAGAVSESADALEGVAITVAEVSGLEDVDGPVDVSASFVSQGAEVVGDEMYLVPFVAMQLDENPFQRAARSFPVDFAYPFTRTYVADLEVPDGWALDGLPDPVQVTIPSRRVSYLRMMSEQNGRLQVRAVLTVAQTEVVPSEYPALRALYDEVVAAESEAVVLVRDLEAAPPPAALEAGADAGGAETDLEGGGQ